MFSHHCCVMAYLSNKLFLIRKQWSSYAYLMILYYRIPLTYSRFVLSLQPIQLSMEEIITLTCGVMFFVSFFIAMTVEIKARHTVYRLFCRFLSHNTEWQIESYEKDKDVDIANNQFV